MNKQPASRLGRVGRARQILAVTAGIAVALAVAGCGSSGGASKASGASSQNTAACMQQAKAGVAKFSESPALQMGDTFDVSKLSGKTVWFINDTLVSPALKLNQEGFVAAAKAAGVTVKTFNANGTVAGMVKGLNEAIAAKPDGIVTAAIAAKLVDPELKNAAAAKIPVVSMYEAEDVPNTIFASVLQDSTRVGQAMADLALSKTNCSFDAGWFQDPNYNTQTDEFKGIKEETTKLCPSCTFESRTYDSASIASSAATNAKQLVVGNRKVNVMFPAADDAAEFIVPALKSTSWKGTIVSAVGLDVGLNFVRNGEMAGDMVQTDDEYDGWAAFDQIARAMAGQPKSPYDMIDSRLLTKANVPADGQPKMPTYANYEDAYKKAWGLS